MIILEEFFFVIVGFAILVKSADFFIEGSVVLAKKLHIEEMIIGITLVALGTSLPELFVNLSASQRNLDDVLVGNVLGSCLFNVLMILGLQLSIRPLKGISKKLIAFDIPVALVLVLLFWFFAADPLGWGGGIGVTRWEGMGLTALYLFFIAKQYHNHVYDDRTISPHPPGSDEGESLLERWSKKFFYLSIILGMGGLYFGSELTVAHSVRLARLLNLSEAFIGVFILSVGTSLPELMTSLMAIRKNYDRLALGNILGSNIANIGIVLAFFSWFDLIAYNPRFNITFVILILITGYLLLALVLKKEKKLSRGEGLTMVFAYVLYAAYSYFSL